MCFDAREQEKVIIFILHHSQCSSRCSAEPAGYGQYSLKTWITYDHFRPRRRGGGGHCRSHASFPLELIAETRRKISWQSQENSVFCVSPLVSSWTGHVSFTVRVAGGRRELLVLCLFEPVWHGDQSDGHLPAASGGGTAAWGCSRSHPDHQGRRYECIYNYI